MVRIKIFLSFIILFIPSAVFCADSARIEVSPPEIQFGNIEDKESMRGIFTITNTGDAPLQIKKIRPSCDCIVITSYPAKILPGSTKDIEIVLNTEGLKNDFKKYIYIQSNDVNRPIIRISVQGKAAEDKNAQDKEKQINEFNNEKIELLLFYSPGCRGCKRIKDVFLSDLARKYKKDILIKTYDINVLENYLRLVSLEEKHGVKENDPIILFVNDRYFSGKKAILNKAESYIVSLIAGDKKLSENVTGVNKGRLLDRFNKFNPFIIISAGFIDGLNPCAFVMAVFLVSFLYISGKTRREILVTGMIFIFAVFLAYLFIGLGLREVLFKLMFFYLISEIIYTLAIFVIIILACYSFYDAIAYLKSENSSGIILKLPNVVRNKIHEVIRRKIGAKGIFFSIFSAGFIVSMLESVCTGQLYLPTIMFLMKEPSVRGSSLLYLVLYNFAFIIPLCIVILFAFAGVNMKKFISFSKINTFIAKIAIAVLLFVFAIMLILGR